MCVQRVLSNSILGERRRWEKSRTLKVGVQSLCEVMTSSHVKKMRTEDEILPRLDMIRARSTSTAKKHFWAYFRDLEV